MSAETRDEVVSLTREVWQRRSAIERAKGRPEAELTWDNCYAELNLDRRIRCRDCGTIDGPGYVVHHHVWAATGLAYDGGVLCLADLARRVGRPLRPDDFPWRVPFNRDNRAAILRARCGMSEDRRRLARIEAALARIEAAMATKDDLAGVPRTSRSRRSGGSSARCATSCG